MNIIIAGDYCPRDRVAKALDEKHYDAVLGDIHEALNDADYSIVNLECPVVYFDTKPIDKCGPNLCCKKNGVEALKWAGFNCITLANNHFLDYGEVGVKNTIDTCNEYNIDYVGGGMTLQDASKILYKEIAGIKLAVINCCEHEFSIASETSAGSNPLNIVKQYYAIKEAREKADKVIVIVHGGVELFWLPSHRMIETYRFFVDAGADAIVNHHQHCYSGYEVYNGSPIFYGLGNFCFDWYPHDYRWTSGYMVKLSFEKNQNIGFEIIPYRQCAEDAKVQLLTDQENKLFFDKLDVYNKIISTDKVREDEYLKWCHQTEGMFKTVLNPILNRYTAWFFKTRFGKRIISKRKMLQTYDYLINESHIERLRHLVETVINKDFQD